MQKKIVSIAMLIALFLLSACGASASSPAPVKIVFAFPQEIEAGQNMLKAAQFALDEIGGKVGNVPVELISFDGGLRENLEINALEPAKNDPNVVAFIGAYTTDHAREIIPAANELGLGVVSMFATWPGLTKTGYAIGEPGVYYPSGERMFFRIIPSDDLQGQVAVEWLVQQDLQTVFIVKEDEPYSNGLTNLLLSNAEDVGISILGTETLTLATLTEDAIKDLVETIAATNPDAIYFPIGGTPDVYDILYALHQGNPDSAIIGGDSLVNLGVPDGYPPVSNIYATNILIRLDQTPALAQFVSDYQAKYETTLTASNYEVIGNYEAMKVVLDAIARAGENPTRASVLKALRNTKDYEGVLGTWSFDSNGDSTFNALGIFTINEGQWVPQ